MVATQLKIHASSACSCTWLCMKRMQRSGSRPAAISSIAVSSVRSRRTCGSYGSGHRVQIDDAEDRFAAVALLIGDVVADRAEIVADVLADPSAGCPRRPASWRRTLDDRRRRASVLARHGQDTLVIARRSPSRQDVAKAFERHVQPRKDVSRGPRHGHHLGRRPPRRARRRPRSTTRVQEVAAWPTCRSCPSSSTSCRAPRASRAEGTARRDRKLLGARRHRA